MRSAWPAILLTLVVGLAGAPAGALAVSSPSGIDPRLRLEWEAGQTGKGRPVISGYLYNDYGRAAINVQLLVETLDAAGQVVDRTQGFVVGGVPVFNRTYFDVPLKAAGAGYRITVTAFEWRDGGGGS
jgi:hypothetical protein